MAESSQKMEFYFILVTRILGLFIGFIPLLPNTLFYLGIADEKIPIQVSEYFFLFFGFFMVWGSKSFGHFAAGLAEKFKSKL